MRKNKVGTMLVGCCFDYRDILVCKVLKLVAYSEGGKAAITMLHDWQRLAPDGAAFSFSGRARALPK